MTNNTESTILICDTEPVAVEGIRALLASRAGLRLIGAAHSLSHAIETTRERAPSIVIVDKAFGVHGILDWIYRLRVENRPTSIIVWGSHLNEAEALRLVQTGALGVIRKSAKMSELLECLEAVATGDTWMQQGLLGERSPSARAVRSSLTARELQVLELVENGLRNKEIAATLGIQPGTVKIHLKHIFEKTGMRGRYELALSCLKEKGLLSLPAA